MIKFPPELVEWIPAIGGLFAMALGGLATLYTYRQAHPRKKSRPVE